MGTDLCRFRSTRTRHLHPGLCCCRTRPSWTRPESWIVIRPINILPSQMNSKQEDCICVLKINATMYWKNSLWIPIIHFRQNTKLTKWNTLLVGSNLTYRRCSVVFCCRFAGSASLQLLRSCWINVLCLKLQSLSVSSNTGFSWICLSMLSQWDMSCTANQTGAHMQWKKLVKLEPPYYLSICCW